VESTLISPELSLNCARGYTSGMRQRQGSTPTVILAVAFEESKGE